MMHLRESHCFKGTALLVPVILVLLLILPIFPARAQMSNSVQENVVRGLGLLMVIYLVNRFGRDREVKADIPDSDPKPDPPPEYTEEDKLLLSQIIYAEARGEPLIGQVAVGAVVINRVESPLFPDTVREVIYQPMQFEPVRRGSMGPTNSNSWEATRRVIDGEDPTDGALFFYNAQILRQTGRWDRLAWFERATVTTTVIGRHTFAVPRY